MLLIFVTFPNRKEAEKIAKVLLEKHLAACVTMLPVSSMYRWEGKIVNEDEIEAIIKTRDDMFFRVEQEIKKLHSYKIPQIIAIPASEVHTSYDLWVDKQVR